MKVYWENFGIHVEAEDDGENEALGLIWNRLRSVRIEEKSISWKSRNSGCTLPSGVSEPFLKVVIANQ